MNAARTVFEDKGYDAALISEIAERAQVVEGTIYRYFENKRALLTKVVEHWYAGMLSDYDHELRHIRGTRNRLRFLIWKHLVTVHDEPALCRLVFQVLRVGDGYRSTDGVRAEPGVHAAHRRDHQGRPGERRVPQRPVSRDSCATPSTARSSITPGPICAVRAISRPMTPPTRSPNCVYRGLGEAGLASARQ